jgi:hypothetical protein
MATAQELLQKRNEIQTQLQQASAPTSANEALRYLSTSVNNFQPLQEERRSLLNQANDVLPAQIQQYTQNRSSDQMGSASPLAQLRSILGTQSRLRETSNLVGDQINQANGRLSSIANDSLGILKQNQDNLQRQFSIANSDYERQLQAEEQERQRQAAARAAAAQAAMYRSQFGGNNDGGQAARGMGESPITVNTENNAQANPNTHWTTLAANNFRNTNNNIWGRSLIQGVLSNPAAGPVAGTAFNAYNTLNSLAAKDPDSTFSKAYVNTKKSVKDGLKKLFGR